MDRRQFLKQTLAAIIGAAITANPRAYAETRSFKLNKPFNTSDVFYGSESGPYNNLSLIDYPVLIKSTPEYKEIERKKIEQGTGKYWILLSQASDRVTKWVKKYALEAELECVVRKKSVTEATFKDVPENYQNLPLDKLVKNIDITSIIIAKHGNDS